jgi:surface polysaccharide O-acyltransferase-like enzyme
MQSVPDYILESQPAYADWSVLHRLAYLIFTGAHLLPLWFVPMISLFYVIAPILVYGDRSSHFYKILPILMLVSLLVPRQELENIPRMFVHFLSVYVFGMFCSHYKNEVLEFSKKWWKPMTVLTLVVVLVSFYEWAYYDQVMYIQKMLLCWFFIYWLWKLDSYVPQTIVFLADISFGIFFIHHYFVIGLRYVQLNILHIEINNVFIYWSLHFALVVALTALLIVGVRRVAGKKSRILIGC